MDNDVNPLPVVIPLVYDDTVAVDSYERVLFVHTAASSLQTFANGTTFAIVYDYSATLEEVFALIRRKFSSIKRVGFAFHNHGDFLNSEPWFSDADLEESQTVFSPNVQFMLDFLREFSVVNVDFFACRTLASEKWRRYFEVLRLGTGVIVGASENDTGNLKYGGDWVMESTMEDIRDVYFHEEVGNWAGLLAWVVTRVYEAPYDFPANNLRSFGKGIAFWGSTMFYFLHTLVYNPANYTWTETRRIVNTTITFGSGTVHAMCTFGGFLYYLHSGGIGRYNISTNSWTNDIIYSDINANHSFLTTDGTYLYAYGRGTAIFRCLLTETTMASWKTVTNLGKGIFAYKSYLYHLRNDNIMEKYSIATGNVDVSFLIGNQTSSFYGPFVIHNSYIYVVVDVVKVFQYDMNGVLTDNTLNSNPSADTNMDTIPTLAVSPDNKLYCAGVWLQGENYRMISISGLPKFPVTISVRPTASSIVYPATLGSISLSGTALTDVCGTVVPGTFQILPAFSSLIYPQGTYLDVSATFTPTDTNTYIPTATTIQSITVLAGIQSALSISGSPTTQTHTPKKTVNLASVVTVRGGATDLSKVYSVSGSRLDYTISGTTLTYQTVGKFPIRISISGSPNYSNDVEVGTDISVNRAPLLLSISGTPITYSATNKTFDITSVLTLSGGSDLSAVYTVSGSLSGFTISGTTLTYTNAGRWPISISMSGGDNYLNDIQIGADISINRLPLAMTVSGTPLPRTYTASNKTVDLATAISISGGTAADVSTLYNVSGGIAGYTISGTTLSYTNFGRVTILISLSGGANYDYIVRSADISINQATISLTASGAPLLLSTYSALNKTVDLTQISLSGGAVDLSPVYSVSGGTGYSISGSILTYQNVGKFPIAVTMSGLNYANTARVGIDISVNKAELLDLSISGEPLISTYSLSNKKVDLKSVLTLSGGAPDISAVYTISGQAGLVFSISGSTLTYVNAGLYPIIVSMSGGTNYSNNKSVKTDIRVAQATQSDLTISGIPGLSTYTLSNKTVNLPSKISLSGGAADLSASVRYSIVSDSGLNYSISGTTLYYQNAGKYPVIVSISGGTNYWNDVSAATDISVNQSSLLPLSISGTPTTKTYTVANKVIDLTTVFTLSGGAKDISAVYTVSGEDTGLTISGTTLTYTFAGKFPITISMSGGMNYNNDVQVGGDISINRALLSLSVSGTPTTTTYYALNKSVNLSSVVTLSGGAADVSPVYSVSGSAGGYTISGTTLYYTNAGKFPIKISISGGKNYNDVQVGTDISINKATLSLTASGAPLLLSTYSALNKTVDLTQISLSGGAADISPVYSVSGGTGGYSISGSILTYQNRGKFPIAVSMSGSNYTNTVKVGIDISVNQAELLDLSISGDPVISTYTLSNKTVDLKTVLTLSGGAPDISAVYTISGGTGLVFSISGSTLTYVNAGLYPIIVSMSGGTNYSNDKFVKTDISVNQATQADLTISGIPGLSTYTLSNKTVNLPSKISLSGGAADLSASVRYSIVSDSGLNYSISGTTLYYQNAGSYPVIVSISGGTNYWNDVSAATDISVNRSSLLPLSISGTPNPKTYTFGNKVIDLTTVFTLSGGAKDISAVYSVSESEGLSISGTTLTYTDAGKFPIIISMSGGINYDNDVQVVSDISINKGTLTDLSISGAYQPSTYTLFNKTVTLTSVLSISGGAPDVPLVYSVSGTTGGYSISGTTLYYENAGIYPIAISMTGGTNYWNNKTIGFDISVNKAALLDLSISGEPIPSEYNLQNKTVDLTTVLTLSGGAQDISAVYTISGETGLVFSISGTTLTYQDVGTYPIIVSMSGSNYSNNVSVKTDIVVNQSTLLDLSISGEPEISTYVQSNKTVDLTKVLTLSGGAQDISAVYTVSGNKEFSISGTILTYVNVGKYPIIVSMSGGTNYSNNVSVATDISVNQATLLELSISGEPRSSEYNLQNKTVDLTQVLTLSGGAVDISAVYTISGETGLEFSISGSTLYYQDVGLYPIIVSMSGGTNYWNDVQVKTDISVNQSTLLDLSISGEPIPTEYNLFLKTIDLTSVLTLSGGAQDISAIYTISGGTGQEFSISGSTLYYKDVGLYPIIVSVSGGKNYSNNVQVKTDISVNQSTLLDLTISGEPRPSTYNLQHKMIDLTSVLTLSGGAQDISAVYSVSGGTDLIYSISGNFLIYEDVGLYPIIVSMSGGTNYSNNKSVNTDISVNQASLPALSVSGTPMKTPYFLADKRVDLRTVISLSGGAADLTPVYTVSSTTDFTYSISGTYLTYETVGTYPLIVSMSKGKNYLNDVQVETEIEITKPRLPDLFVVGTPEPVTYNLFSKTVDLLSIVTLSGGAEDVTAIYSVSGEAEGYTISGTIFTYTNAGRFPIVVSMLRGMNYSNDVFAYTDISINKAEQAELSISGEPRVSEYNLLDKTVDLTQVLTLSGGAQDIAAVYTISGGTGLEFSISGTILYYKDVGTYPIIVSSTGGTNYSNDTFVKTDIRVNQSVLLDLSISGEPIPSEYNLLNKTVDLTQVLTLSGGAQDISAVYTISGGTDLIFSISGSTLYYQDVGLYPIIVSMSGGTNYSNDVFVKTDIRVNQSTLLDLSISGEPRASEYNLFNKTVDLTSVLTLSGGAQDISAVYTISGETGLNFSISGSILTYENVGLYPIIVSMSGGTNYSNDVFVKTDISVNQSVLLDLSISGEPRVSEYTLLNKSVDLLSVLTLSGGAQDISAVYTISGETGLEFSISGSILYYEDVGLYPIIVSMSGGTNYSNDVQVKTDISVNRTRLDDIFVVGTPETTPYTLGNKYVDLTRVLTLSGGAADLSFVYSVSSSEEENYSISGSILAYEDAGTYPIVVSMSRGKNYLNDVSQETAIVVDQIEQPPISISGTPESRTYTLSNKTVDLTTVLTLSGGAPDLRSTVVYSVSGGFADSGTYSISGTIFTYENAGSYPIAISISGGKNYLNDVTVGTDISINKDIQPALFVVGTPIPYTFQTTNKTVDLLMAVTLSGGAPDLSSTVIYSISGDDTTYSISGSTFSYENAGRFPISISISGGKNYSNDVITGTDISINKATVPLSISGTPSSYVFSHFSRTVTLSSAISLSGGSPGVSAIFSGPNVVDGATLVYTDVSSYPIQVFVPGGINYTDTSASTFISITKDTIPLSISGSPTSYTFDPLNKNVTLSEAISLSGGALGAVASYSGPNVNGSILTYTDVSSYPVNVSVYGAPNYTDTFASTSISITKATVPLTISGSSVTFNFTDRNVPLTSAISIFGGAPGVTPIYTGTAVNGGSTLTYTNAGSYTVNVFVPGGINYTDTSASTVISVLKATIPLSVSQASTITFHPVNKDVSLLSAISISGGAQDVSARYNSAGVNGTTLTYTNAGSYLVNVTISGGDNYTDTAASTLVVITKATQQPSFVLSSYSVIYDPRSKSTNLSGRGSGGIEGATTSFSGTNVQGTTLSYTTIGSFPVTATKSFPNYFDSIASYTVTVMYPNPDAGTSAEELKAAGYSLAELFEIGYTTTTLLSIGYTAAELKVGVLAYGGFTETQLTKLGYTALQLQRANYTKAELESVGFTLYNLLDLGYTSTKLLSAGYSSTELKTAVLSKAGGFTTLELTTLAYTASQLQAAGYTVQELRSIGYTISLLFDLGFTVTKLFEAGYSAVELKTAVIAAGGLTAAQLNALAYTAAQLQEQEYTAAELKSAGYTLAQLYAAGYTTGALYDAGYNAAEIQDSVPIAGYTVPELRDIGFAASQLRPAGYFLAPLVDGGFTAQNLKDALFQPAELLPHFPAEELYTIFTTPREKATVTKAVVADLFSPSVSKVSGLSVASMVGYTFSNIVTDVTAVVASDPLNPTTFRLSDFNNGSTAIYAIIDVSGSAVVFPTQNTQVTIVNTGKETYRVLDASGAIYRDNLLIGNRFTIDGLTVVIGSVVASMAVLTVSQLISKGFTTAEKLIDAGYTAAKLELAGYTAMQLEIAGFTAKNLMAVGYTAIQLQTAGYNATRLLTAGFTSTDLESIGYTEPLLRIAQFRAAQLQAAGYTATQLRSAGYSVTELKSIGYTSAQLQAAGFSLAPKQMKPSWLQTSSNNITFPERNEILCHASTISGENVFTLEGFKTCVLQFMRPGFETNYTCYIEKRYATVTLYSTVPNTETYALTFRTRNIAGNLRYLVNFELNGVVIKTDTIVDGKWNLFSMILHENDITVLVDDLQWFIYPRTVLSSRCVYKTKFNLNHDKTNIKHISFFYFQNATNKISYTIPANLPSLVTNSFTFDYLEGAIRELRDISAGGPTLTLHVQNINYDLDKNNRIPIISTLIHSEEVLSSNAYTSRIYLSKDATQGTLYDVMLSDTSANTRAKLIRGKTVTQQLRYVNSDGSGQVLSDIQVYLD